MKKLGDGATAVTVSISPFNSIPKQTVVTVPVYITGLRGEGKALEGLLHKSLTPRR